MIYGLARCCQKSSLFLTCKSNKKEHTPSRILYHHQESFLPIDPPPPNQATTDDKQYERFFFFFFRRQCHTSHTAGNTPSRIRSSQSVSTRSSSEPTDDNHNHESQSRIQCTLLRLFLLLLCRVVTFAIQSNPTRQTATPIGRPPFSTRTRMIRRRRTLKRFKPHIQ